jgi:Tfp pilus assembly protein PilZ
MRLLTLSFNSADEFLQHYSDERAEGAVFHRTRTDLESGDEVLFEVAFPGLPNRALVRGRVLGRKQDGYWLLFDPADTSTRDFLLDLARGDVEITKRPARGHSRFPADVPVSYKLDGSSSSSYVTGRAADLGPTGVFVRADEPPEVGSGVELVIGPLGDEEETFTVHGKVTNQRDEDGARGFAVHFDGKSADSSRLRKLLRNASETGRVSL